MGDALSKACGDEPADVATEVALPPAAPAPAVAATVNRRRTKARALGRLTTRS